MGEKQELSTEEAAALAGVSSRHIRRMLRTGELQGQRVGRWVWIVRRSEIERWKRERAEQKARR